MLPPNAHVEVKKKGNKDGFTLVEVMIASAITVTAVLGIYTAMIMFHTMILSTRLHEEAETMAMDRIWTVFNMDYEALRNFTPNPTVEVVPDTSILYPLGGTLRVAVLNDTNACDIMVAVNWQELTFGRSTKAVQQSFGMRRANTRR